MIPLLLPTSPIEFWTMIVGIGTIALGLVAYLGLRSLTLAQAEMLTRATREARQCAVNKCEDLAKALIPQNSRILSGFATRKVPVFVQNAEQVRFDPDHAKHIDAAQDWVSRLPKELYGQCVALLNDLEAWSMYFTNGLADHQIAFRPCAPIFCRMIVENYAILLVLRASDTAGKFPNAVQLFQSWLERLEEEKRGLKQGDLLKELARLQARGGYISHSLPDPLGTKLDKPS